MLEKGPAVLCPVGGFGLLSDPHSMLCGPVGYTWWPLWVFSGLQSLQVYTTGSSLWAWVHLSSQASGSE